MIQLYISSQYSHHERILRVPLGLLNQYWQLYRFSINLSMPYNIAIHFALLHNFFIKSCSFSACILYTYLFFNCVKSLMTYCQTFSQFALVEIFNVSCILLAINWQLISTYTASNYSVILLFCFRLGTTNFLWLIYSVIFTNKSFVFSSFFSNSFIKLVCTSYN